MDGEKRLSGEAELIGVLKEISKKLDKLIDLSRRIDRGVEKIYVKTGMVKKKMMFLDRRGD